MSKRTLLLAGPGACLLLYGATLLGAAGLEAQLRQHCQRGLWRLNPQASQVDAWEQACNQPTTYP